MKYSPVFAIEILHDFYGVSKPPLFQVVPTKETIQQLKDAGMITKYVQNKLYVFVKHIDDNIPLLKIPNDFILQFFMEVIDFDFGKITNYSESDPYNRKLYFSNLKSIIDQNSKSIEGDLYLHEKLPQFNAANAYQYNDLVRSGSNIVYECLTKIDANTGNLNNGNQFRKLDKISYVTSQTSLLFSGTEKTIRLNAPAPTASIQYFEFNPVTELFDKEKKSSTIGLEQNPTAKNLETVLLSFTDKDGKEFSEGIYRVIINAQEELIYYRSRKDWQSYIGLINIHNSDLVPANYQYLKPDGSFFTVPPANTVVATKNYIIRFAPAQYLLKYVCKTNKVLDIIDEDGKIEFDNLGGNVFRSKLPVRMSEKAIDTISVQYDGADVIKKTKNPGYRDLSILEGDSKYLVTETFLNL